MSWASRWKGWFLRRYLTGRLRSGLTCSTWVRVPGGAWQSSRGKPDSGQFIGNWHFESDSLDWGNDILANILSSQLVIVDELGPLELTNGSGLVNGIELITRRGYRLACVVVRPSLLENAIIRWPWGEIFFVDPNHPSEAPE